MRSTILFLITLVAMASPWAANARLEGWDSPAGGMFATGFDTSVVYDISVSDQFSLSFAEADPAIPLALNENPQVDDWYPEISDSNLFAGFATNLNLGHAHLALGSGWYVAPPSPEPDRIMALPHPSGPPMPSEPSSLTRTFAVFFDLDSSRLDDTAAETVALATETARQGDMVIIQVIGQTNAAEPVLHDLDLADRRAAAVKAALVNDGIPEGDIAVTGKGLEHPVTLTRSRAWEPHNRAVIDLGT
jgi:outer membrane protein OmpA-like peptidoglycan-associated protein